MLIKKAVIKALANELLICRPGPEQAEIMFWLKWKESAIEKTDDPYRNAIQTWARTVECIADLCQIHNPEFNRDKFYVACGYKAKAATRKAYSGDANG